MTRGVQPPDITTPLLVDLLLLSGERLLKARELDTTKSRVMMVVLVQVVMIYTKHMFGKQIQTTSQLHGRFKLLGWGQRFTFVFVLFNRLFNLFKIQLHTHI